MSKRLTTPHLSLIAAVCVVLVLFFARVGLSYPTMFMADIVFIFFLSPLLFIGLSRYAASVVNSRNKTIRRRVNVVLTIGVLIAVPVMVFVLWWILVLILFLLRFQQLESLVTMAGVMS